MGIYSRQQPDRIETSLGIDELDSEGRCIIVRFGRTTLFNAYFPKGNGANRDNSRVPYKLSFYDALYRKMQTARKRGPVFVMGDYNTAHQEVDLARPKTKSQEQRVSTRRTRCAGSLDQGRLVRYFPQSTSRSTGTLHLVATMGWRPRQQRGAGALITFFASPSAQRKVSNAFIMPEITGSDHCPVGIDTGR